MNLNHGYLVKRKSRRALKKRLCYGVSGIDQNDRSESTGIGVRIAPDWISGMLWNMHFNELG